MTLKDILYNEIQMFKTLSRDNLRKIGRQNNYDEATTDRVLRQLTEKKEIFPIYNGKYIKEYTIEKQINLF